MRLKLPVAGRPSAVGRLVLIRWNSLFTEFEQITPNLSVQLCISRFKVLFAIGSRRCDFSWRLETEEFCLPFHQPSHSVDRAEMTGP